MTLGSRIQEQRKKLGLTQPQLAESLSMSLNTVKQLETDRVKPSIETLEKLTTMFKVSADYLLGYADAKTVYKLPDSVIDHVIRETEEKYDVNLSDDPAIKKMMTDLIENLAKMKKDTK